MKKKLLFISCGLLALLIAILSIVFFLHSKDTKARDRVINSWIQTIEQQKFDQIPKLVTNNSILKQDFTEKTVVDKGTALHF